MFPEKLQKVILQAKQETAYQKESTIAGDEVRPDGRITEAA
jgi:hypothetical protein